MFRAKVKVFEAKIHLAEISRDTFMLKNAQLIEKNQKQFEEIQELKAILRDCCQKPTEFRSSFAQVWRPAQQ